MTTRRRDIFTPYTWWCRPNNGLCENRVRHPSVPEFTYVRSSRVLRMRRVHWRHQRPTTTRRAVATNAVGLRGLRTGVWPPADSGGRFGLIRVHRCTGGRARVPGLFGSSCTRTYRRPWPAKTYCRLESGPLPRSRCNDAAVLERARARRAYALVQGAVRRRRASRFDGPPPRSNPVQIALVPLSPTGIDEIGRHRSFIKSTASRLQKRYPSINVDEST